MANYLTYPCKYLRITQGHTGMSHSGHSDYPWDEGCSNSGSGTRDWMYCPCNEMKIVRIYTAGTNTIFLESTSPVVFADGTSDYVSMQVTHSNNSDFTNLYKGKTFTRGEKICREGEDGGVGTHLHFSAGKGKFSNQTYCWYKNGNGKWCISTTSGVARAKDLFYVDESFTKILNNSLNIPKLPSNAVIDDTVTLTNGNIQIDRSAKYDKVDTEILWKYLLIHFENPYAVAGIMGNMYYESRFYSSSIEGNVSDNRTLSTDYTNKVDNGTYSRDYFINHGKGKKEGYGLVGWTAISLKEGLYDYWQSVGGSISSPYTQIEYLFNVISTSSSYSTLNKELKDAKSVRDAAVSFVRYFEICQGWNTESVQKERSDQGQIYYDLYKDITIDQAKADFSSEEQVVVEEYFNIFGKIKWMAIGVPQE